MNASFFFKINKLLLMDIFFFFLFLFFSFSFQPSPVFNWTGTHDVAEVAKENYDNCTDTAIGSIQTTSPANFTLTTNATRYFICTISSHCEVGQKVRSEERRVGKEC